MICLTYKRKINEILYWEIWNVYCTISTVESLTILEAGGIAGRKEIWMNPNPFECIWIRFFFRIGSWERRRVFCQQQQHHIFLQNCFHSSKRGRGFLVQGEEKGWSFGQGGGWMRGVGGGGSLAEGRKGVTAHACHVWSKSLFIFCSADVFVKRLWK